MPPQPPDPERRDLLLLAASMRMESRLLREATKQTRDRSLLICADSRVLLERCAGGSGDGARPRGGVLARI